MSSPVYISCILASFGADVRPIFKSVIVFRDTVAFQPAGSAWDMDMLR